MKREHARQRELVLCHEDLAGPERAEADAHLASCAACRSLLQRVRELEREEPRGKLPPLDLGAGAAALTPLQREEAAGSLRLLRARLGLEPAREGPRRLPRRGSPWVPPRGRVVAVPLALAALIAVAMLVGRDREQPGVQDLRVLPYSLARGGPDTLDAAPAIPWRTGDSFVLAFDLARAAHPVVFHVGPAGEVSLLHPAAAGSPVPRLPAGRGHRLPPIGGAEVWTLEGAAGAETFLVAAAETEPPGLEAVLARARALGRPERRRHDLIAALVALLSAELGPVEFVEIEHAP